MGRCPARKLVPCRGGCGILGGTCQLFFTRLPSVLALPTLIGRQNLVPKIGFLWWAGDSPFLNNGQVLLDTGSSSSLSSSPQPKEGEAVVSILEARNLSLPYEPACG